MLVLKKVSLLTFILFGLLTICFGQEKKAKKEDKTLSVLPFAAYRPESSLFFGGIGVLQKRFNIQDTISRKSQLVFGFLYSLRNQAAIFVEPDIFIRGEDYRIKGLASVRKEVDKYWGIGNFTPSTNEEQVDNNLARFELGFYKKFGELLFLGVQTRYNNVFSLEAEEESQLIADKIRGFEGALVAGLGPAAIIDARNQSNNPIKGYFLEISSTFHKNTFGSEFDFNRVYLDFRYFKKMHKEKNHIIAYQLFSNLNFGSPTWNQFAELGGDPLRGYFKGRFRDHHMVSTQIEYRSPLIVGRLSAVAFTGMGKVFNDKETFNFSYLKPSFGGGLRFMVDKVDRLNIRIDYAFGEAGNSGFYFGFQEAF